MADTQTQETAPTTEPVVQVAPTTEIQTPAVNPDAPLGTQPPAIITPVTPRQPADPLSDPRVQAEIRKASLAAADAARKEAQQAAQVAAERAQMDEITRTKAEKADSDTARQTAETKAKEAELTRDIALSLVATGVQLADPNAMDFLKWQLESESKKQPGADAATVVASVLQAHPYLVKAAQAVVDPSATVVTPVVQAPTTVSAPAPRVTQTPAVINPNVPDVMKMTKAEYDEYKRTKHGMH